ncbi:MAG: hypothetical protein EAX81_08260 [Candidatus Thorarchaeota archaeon]|nr:hypothetical protein [Candidatus Thorarchaeota archaeon]
MHERNEDSLAGKGRSWRETSRIMRKMRPLRNNERTLIQTIESLDDKYQGLVVIVEGRRDEAILKNLGLRSPIIKTQAGISRLELVENIVAEVGSSGQVLILTDYDVEGEEIRAALEQELEIRHIRILRGVRNRIQRLMGNWRCIEEMVSLFKRKDSPEPAS